MVFLVVIDSVAAGFAVLFGYMWLAAGVDAPAEKVARFRRGTIGMILWVALITAKLAL